MRHTEDLDWARRTLSAVWSVSPWGDLAAVSVAAAAAVEVADAAAAAVAMTIGRVLADSQVDVGVPEDCRLLPCQNSCEVRCMSLCPILQ